MNKAILILENGEIFKGRSFGYKGETGGEVVFNTSMTGYQEVLTDPSYNGQIVAMTATEIGNYGVNHIDVESGKIQVAGFVVKESSKIDSNWQSEGTLHDYLEAQKICGIEGVDTRKLTRILRIKGSMNGIISAIDFDIESLKNKLKNLPDMNGLNLVPNVTIKEPVKWQAFDKKNKLHLVAIHTGIKENILRLFAERGVNITLVPDSYTANQIMELAPNGIFVSNGPGDPAAVKNVIETIKGLIGKVPMFGICLGHQMLSIALGGPTFKLKFGHHGANQPVKNLATNSVEITSQNHGFAVMDEKLPEDIEVTHINLNDNTIEGFKHKKYPIFSVQYHPEASPGPHDSLYLFDDFIKLMREWKA